MALSEYQTITLLVHVGAGSGLSGGVAAQVAEGVRALCNHACVEVIESRSKQHVTEIGRTSAADLIVCLSGDGTLHDVAQSLVDRPSGARPTLAVIPAGSGNDYALTLGMPLDPLKALAALPGCQPVTVDVGRVNSTYFLETLSFGVDAAVALNTEELRLSTKTRGARLYARAAVSAILREFNAHEVLIKQGESERRLSALILAVQNGPTYGGGFKVAPRASITDSLLDVYTASNIGKLKGLYYLSQMKGGKHEHLKGFSSFQTAKLELEFTKELPVQCDGERLTGTHFAIEVVPAALDVLAAPSAVACRQGEECR